jgi:flagellar assembly protein FliH
MHLSNVFFKEYLSKSNVGVLDYKPPQLDIRVTPVVEKFVEHRKQSISSFKISLPSAVVSGVQELERDVAEAKLEKEAAEQLLHIQEVAYKEAYQLGLDEGKTASLEEGRSRITEQMQRLDQLIGNIGRIFGDLIVRNEREIVELALSLACEVVRHSVEEKRDTLVAILKDFRSTIEGEPRVTIYLNPDEVSVVHNLIESSSKDFAHLKQAQLEGDPRLGKGGVIVETPHGVVDSSIDKRIQKLWEAVLSRAPHIQSQRDPL